MTPARPVPAVAAGDGPFRVVSGSLLSGGACAVPRSGAEGVFSAPLDNESPKAIAIREHEYGHLALEGLGILARGVLEQLVGKYRISEGWAQAGLDVIVNGYMLARGAAEIVHLEPCSLPLPIGLSRSDAAQLSLRSTLLSCSDSLSEPLAALGNFDAADRKLLSQTGALFASITAARKKIRAGAIAVHLEILQAFFGPHQQDSTSDDPREMSDSVIDPVLKDQLISTPTGTDPKWGEMDILYRPLPSLYSPARKALHHRPSYAGPFRYAHRASIPVMDGRAFGSRVLRADGTALIDCSGSMRLTSEHLKEIFDILPAATIAAYSGLPNDQQRGWLSIVARNGRMADLASLASYMGSYNTIDGPALEWLIRQRSPHFWISDGLVNGIGGKVSTKMILQIVDKVRSGRIRRYADPPSLTTARPR